MADKDKNKKIATTVLVLIPIAAVLGLVATIMMFGDFYGVDPYYSTYNHHINYVHIDHPESGIMPLIAMLLTFVSIVLSAVGKNQKKVLKISNIPSVIAAILFLFSCFAACFTQYDVCAADPETGYWIGAFPAGILLIVSIILRAKLLKSNIWETQKPIVQAQASPDNSAAQQEKSNNSLDKAETLKKYKELLDDGVISQEEYESMKKEVIFD